MPPLKWKFHHLQQIASKAGHPKRPRQEGNAEKENLPPPELAPDLQSLCDANPISGFGSYEKIIISPDGIPHKLGGERREVNGQNWAHLGHISLSHQYKQHENLDLLSKSANLPSPDNPVTSGYSANAESKSPPMLNSAYFVTAAAGPINSTHQSVKIVSQKVEVDHKNRMMAMLRRQQNESTTAPPITNREPSRATIWQRKKRNSENQQDDLDLNTKGVEEGGGTYRDISAEGIEHWVLKWPRVPQKIKYLLLNEGIRDLWHILRGKRKRPSMPQDLEHYSQVLHFMNWQIKKPELTRKEAASMAVVGFGRGQYSAKRVLQQEREWITKHTILHGNQGKHAKAICMLEDEGTSIAVREYLSGAGEPHDLATAVTKYWETRTNQKDTEDRASWVYQSLLHRKETGKLSLTASSAVRWLKRLGFQWREVRKGVFIDGHEKEDVVDYQKNTFIPGWTRLEPRMPKWDSDGRYIAPILRPGEKVLIPCAHDECTFHSNDGIHQRWVHKDKRMIRKKSRGQGLIVSDFLLPWQRLEVPADIPWENLPSSIRNRIYKRMAGVKMDMNRRHATEFIKVGQDSYWRGEDMLQHTLEIAIPMFETTFPEAQGLFLFDHAASHTADAPDALRVTNLNMKPGGKQPKLRDTWFYEPNGVTLHKQEMCFREGDMTVPEEWWGKPKGLEILIKERGIWPTGGLHLDCATWKRKEDRSHHGTNCCARHLLSIQPDFLEQKSRLQEQIERRGHICLFLLKYHCELNWIEYYWGRAKWFTRKNCKYTWPALLKTVPQAFASVPSKLISKYWLKTLCTLHAYREGLRYGTEQFTEKVYQSHRRVSTVQLFS